MLDYLKSLKNTGISAFAMILVLSVIRFIQNIYSFNEIFILILTIIAGVSTYGLVFWTFFRTDIKKVISLVKSK